jgi:predicted MFS family arabinose efflux permease
VLLLATLAFFGLGEILLGQSATFWMALVAVTLVNFMAAITDVLHQSLLQLSVSNEQRGRAMGSWIVGIGSAPVGQLELGYLAELTSSRIALLVNGMGLAALALVMATFMPRLRRL